MANARVTQSIVEVIALPSPSARVTQSVIEFLVGLGISCNNPPGGSLGVPYSHFFTAGAGQTPYVFTISAGSLPGGLSLNAATGEASGSPSAPGTFAFTVTVTDAFLATNSVDCSIVIAGALRIALYGYKIVAERPACDLVEVEDLPPVPRVL